VITSLPIALQQAVAQGIITADRAYGYAMMTQGFSPWDATHAYNEWVGPHTMRNVVKLQPPDFRRLLHPMPAQDWNPHMRFRLPVEYRCYMLLVSAGTPYTNTAWRMFEDYTHFSIEICGSRGEMKTLPAKVTRGLALYERAPRSPPPAFFAAPLAHVQQLYNRLMELDGVRGDIDGR
jgi:hypothetical protein